MSSRLGGWQRIGIVLSALWILAVAAYAVFELASGPDSAMLLIQMVVSKTGEPITVLDGNAYRDLVPVEPKLLVGRLLIALFVPVVTAWVLAYACAWAVRWVIAGFRRNGT